MTTGADAFADATALALGQSSEPTPAGSYTTETGEPYPASGRTAWWRWTAPATPATQLVLVDTMLMPAGADTVVTVYTGSSVDALTEVAVSDDVDPDNVDYRSFLIFTAQAGATYHLQVDSWGSTPPDYVLRLRPGYEGPLVPAATYVAANGRDGTLAQRIWLGGAPAYGAAAFPFTLQPSRWDRNADAAADATVFDWVRGALPGIIPLGMGEHSATDSGAQRNPWGFETVEWFVAGYHADLDFFRNDAATYLPPKADWPAGAVARVYEDGSTERDVTFGTGSVAVDVADGNPELGVDATLMPGLTEYPVSAFLHQNPPGLTSPWGMPETFPSDLPATAQQRFSANGGFATWAIDPLVDQRVTLAHDFIADGVLPVDLPGTGERWSYDVTALTVTAEMIVPAFRYVFTEPLVAGLPPCRVFPRDDGLGASAGPRVWPPPKSQQGSSRIGPGSYW